MSGSPTPAELQAMRARLARYNGMTVSCQTEAIQAAELSDAIAADQRLLIDALESARAARRAGPEGGVMTTPTPAELQAMRTHYTRITSTYGKRPVVEDAKAVLSLIDALESARDIIRDLLNLDDRITSSGGVLLAEVEAVKQRARAYLGE